MKKLLSLILLGTLFVGLNGCMSTTKTKENVLIKNEKVATRSETTTITKDELKNKYGEFITENDVVDFEIKGNYIYCYKENGDLLMIARYEIVNSKFYCWRVFEYSSSK